MKSQQARQCIWLSSNIFFFFTQTCLQFMIFDPIKILKIDQPLNCLSNQSMCLSDCGSSSLLTFVSVYTHQLFSKFLWQYRWLKTYKSVIKNCLPKESFLISYKASDSLQYCPAIKWHVYFSCNYIIPRSYLSLISARFCLLRTLRV